MAARIFNRNAVGVLALVASGACATGAGTLFSAEGAMQMALGEMCAPVVMGGASMDAIAEENRIAEVDPTSDSTGQSNRRWLLPSVNGTDVTLWEDGSCMVAIRRGNPEQWTASALDVMGGRGLDLIEGMTMTAPDDGVRTAYCESGSQPYFLAVTTPGAGANRPAIVVTLMQAKGQRPDFCQTG